MILHAKAFRRVGSLQSYIMAQPGRSWSSIAAGPQGQTQQPSGNTSRPRPNYTPDNGQKRQQVVPHSEQKQQAPVRSTSPHYTPKTASEEDNVYVLTILTDAKHHETMTKWRRQYFPPRLNRLEAHLTLFHALPGSKLEEAIKPVLAEVCASTSPFPVLAAKPFRLNKGIAIGVPKTRGGEDARKVHRELQEAWKEFLSRQDAGGFAAHYTIMNKMDDESAVQKAFSEVESQWNGCHGRAEGLSLFLYERGNWVHVEDFRFSAAA